MTFGVTLGETLMMVASAKMFNIAIDYTIKTYMVGAASYINIKMNQPFSKQWILSVRVTIVQRKNSVDVKRTYF